MSNPIMEHLIIEVEGYDGDDGQIVVENYRAERKGMGRPNVIYCIGEMNEDGVIRITDWGYATLGEVRRTIAGVKRHMKRIAKDKEAANDPPSSSPSPRDAQS